MAIEHKMNVKYASHVILAPIGYRYRIAFASIYIINYRWCYSKFTATNLNSAHMSQKTVAHTHTHTVLIHINLYIKRPRQGQYFQWVTLLRTFVHACNICIFYVYIYKVQEYARVFPGRDFNTFTFVQNTSSIITIRLLHNNVILYHTTYGIWVRHFN